MTHYRSLALLFPALLLAAGCGTGRLAPSEGGPTASPAPEPAPAVEPAPTITPEPGPVSAGTADTTASAPAGAGYAPYGGTASVQIRRIGQYSQSGITASERRVIRDETSYAQFWSSLGAGGQRPPVDFTRDVVVAVAGGQRNTGGYSIAVDRVDRSGSGVAVEVVETTPGRGCLMTQALTQPVDVVVVAAAEARTWSFRERRVEQPCE